MLNNNGILYYGLHYYTIYFHALKYGNTELLHGMIGTESTRRAGKAAKAGANCVYFFHSHNTLQVLTIAQYSKLCRVLQ